MRIVRHAVYLLCLLAVSLLLPIIATSAQEQSQTQSALAVSPAIAEQVLVPGEAKQFTIRVTNTTRVALPITTTVRNFVPQEEVEDASKQATFDASKWFEITGPDFILQPDQTKEVGVILSPPADAIPGGHYATVYFQPLIPEGVLTENTAYLSARVGVLTFIIVSGEIDYSLQASGIQAPGVSQTGPVSLKLSLENRGNVHVLPGGDVTIKDWRGRTVAKLPVTTGMVLPETTREFIFTWDKRFTIGKYTAQARLTYGPDSTETLTEPVTFWIIPWAYALIGGGFLLITYVFVKRTRSRWKHAWAVLRGKSAGNVDK